MYYFTELGYQNFLTKIENTKKELIRAQKELGHAADIQGDGWHDNFAFEQLQQQITMLSIRINELNGDLQKAIIVRKNVKAEKVEICSTVSCTRDGEEESWYICGHDESAPKQKKLAYNTPLGKGFFGKKVGDVFEFRGSVYVITEIS